jgi:hypothetical protein
MPQARTTTITLPPAAPGAAAAAQAPAANVVTPQMLSRRDVEALRARGEELSRQIKSASDRRESTRQALRSASGADKSGLEQRLGVLDARIARLESDIAENGEALASIPARLAVAETRGTASGANNRSGDRFMDNLVPMVVVFTLFVLTPIAVSISRMFWKRGSMPARAVQSPENAQRLERMEQAIDTIAIEMERVSEGQRFITRILSEGRAGVALPEGQRSEPNALPRY